MVYTKVKNSWEAVEEEMIIKSFRKFGINNAMDGNNISDESNETESGDELNIASTNYFNNK